MFNPLKLVDSSILTFFQRVSDYCEYRFDLTCFALARFVVVLAQGGLVVYGLATLTFPISLVAIAILPGTVLLIVGTMRYERILIGKRSRNPLERAWWFRMMMLLLLPLSRLIRVMRVGFTQDDLLFITVDCLLIIFLYLWSCTPLPPGEKDRRREEATTKKFVLKPARL